MNVKYTADKYAERYDFIEDHDMLKVRPKYCYDNTDYILVFPDGTLSEHCELYNIQKIPYKKRTVNQQELNSIYWEIKGQLEYGIEENNMTELDSLIKDYSNIFIVAENVHTYTVRLKDTIFFAVINLDGKDIGSIEYKYKTNNTIAEVFSMYDMKGFQDFCTKFSNILKNKKVKPQKVILNVDEIICFYIMNTDKKFIEIEDIYRNAVYIKNEFEKSNIESVILEFNVHYDVIEKFVLLHSDLFDLIGDRIYYRRDEYDLDCFCDKVLGKTSCLITDYLSDFIKDTYIKR